MLDLVVRRPGRGRSSGGGSVPTVSYGEGRNWTVVASMYSYQTGVRRPARGASSGRRGSRWERQSGQVVRPRSIQPSMHARWKACAQLPSRRTSSVAWSLSKHTMHVGGCAATTASPAPCCCSGRGSEQNWTDGSRSLTSSGSGASTTERGGGRGVLYYRLHVPGVVYYRFAWQMKHQPTSQKLREYERIHKVQQSERRGAAGAPRGA